MIRVAGVSSLSSLGIVHQCATTDDERVRSSTDNSLPVPQLACQQKAVLRPIVLPGCGVVPGVCRRPCVALDRGAVRVALFLRCRVPFADASMGVSAKVRCCLGPRCCACMGRCCWSAGPRFPQRTVSDEAGCVQRCMRAQPRQKPSGGPWGPSLSAGARTREKPLGCGIEL